MIEDKSYSRIPETILIDKTLSMSAKIFYGDILSLSRRKGVCFAGNDYFSERYGLTERRCTQIIKELTERNYISVKITKFGVTKTLREITPLVIIKKQKRE